jgi:hypothetical protein
MLKRWDRLTLFPREPGAPLDNNVCERALKMSTAGLSLHGASRTQDWSSAGRVCALEEPSPMSPILKRLSGNASTAKQAR